MTATWTIEVSSPVFHHSTDDYIGERVTVEGYFSTYMGAAEALFCNYNSHEGYGIDFDSPHAYIVLRVNKFGKIRNYSMRELEVNSHYTGPASAWENAPF